MMRKAGLLILGIAIAALTGCSANKSTSPIGSTGLTPDQAAVQTSIADQAGVLDDGLSGASGAPTGFSARGTTSPLSIVPEGEPGDPIPTPPAPVERRFWRVITSVERSFDITFSEPDADGHTTAAEVVVHKHLTGEFHLQYAETIPSSTGGDSVVVRQVVKPLKDHWVRHVWLARRPWAEAATDPQLGWRVVGASVVQVTSEIGDGGTQPHILSVHVQSGDQEATFTDPATAILWAEVWHPASGTAVNLTVTTDQPDDVVVLAYRDGRVRLAPNGDNTYSGTWMPSGESGLKHFGIDALSNATLFDNEAGYHSNGWFMPFVHAGEVLAGAAN